MTETWDLDAGSGKVEFTKFSPGVAMIRVLSKVPNARFVHWLNNYQRSVTCPGLKVCPICKVRKAQKDAGEDYTLKMAKSFSLNIYNYDMDRYEIMEQGITFMEDLKLVMQDLKAEGKQLSDAVLKVRRTGTNKDNTKYRIDVHEQKPLSEKELEVMEEMKDLPEYFKPHTPEQIQALLDATSPTVDGYKEIWKSVMEGPKEDEQEESQEEIQVEGE